MKSTFTGSQFVIPKKAGIQLNQAPGFGVKPEMTIDGLVLYTVAMKVTIDKKVEFA